MKRAIKATLIGLGSLVGLVLLLAIVLPLAFKPQVLRCLLYTSDAADDIALV